MPKFFGDCHCCFSCCCCVLLLPAALALASRSAAHLLPFGAAPGTLPKIFACHPARGIAQFFAWLLGLPLPLVAAPIHCWLLSPSTHRWLLSPSTHRWLLPPPTAGCLLLVVTCMLPKAAHSPLAAGWKLHCRWSLDLKSCKPLLREQASC